VLELNGYAVDEASTTDGAFGKMNGSSYDLVLLDINLSPGSGFEVLTFIKEKAPQTKVIMLTGVVGLGQAIRSARSGADEYLTKPFDVEYLLHSIKTLLAEQESL